MDTPPGAELFARLAAAPDADAVELRKTECLASCDRGCTAAIAMPGRWTWLLGRLGPEKADDLLAYARLYAASPRGTVMPSRRPATLSDMVLGRVPAALFGAET
jgi:predicted metal-binding protein